MKSVCSGLDSWNVIVGLIQIMVFRFVLVSVICWVASFPFRNASMIINALLS